MTLTMHRRPTPRGPARRRQSVLRSLAALDDDPLLLCTDADCGCEVSHAAG